MTQRFFDRPTQVAFYDKDNEGYIGGIAYGTEIICLECGGIVDIENYLDEVKENHPEVKFPIIPLDWVSLSTECLGDLHFNMETGEVSV